LFARAPMLGNGAGSFRSLFPPMRTADLSSKFYDHAHNDYAQILAEYGLIGAFIVVSLLALGYKNAFAALRKRTDKLSIGVAFSVIFGLSSLLIHGIADFNFQIPANAATFSVLLALGWISRYGLRDVTSPSRRHGD
jgi:O-antigen ligase